MPPITCLIPAEPRTYVLIGSLEADQFNVIKINVVAWTAAGEGIVPITVAGPNHGRGTKPAVLQPDGTVEDAQGFAFANQDEWKRVAVKHARAAEIVRAA